MIIKVY